MPKTIERTIEIDRSVNEVWGVLVDFPSHSEWNPFIRQISGNRQVGDKLKVHIAPNGKRGMKFSPVVTAATAPSELAWLGKLGIHGLFDGAHRFSLKAVNERHTTLTQSETFSGLLVGLFGGTLDATGEGFEQMNQALKLRCESR
ncbi:MAG: hypothetical protein QOF16_809 [Actinomycetota bacterium]|jgi:hypothetical protein|nr:hypothetical protein [Actinomycetota bacterium]